MLNNMEAAMLKASGYRITEVGPVAPGQFRATATKGEFRAAALGRSREDAERKLVATVTRP